MFHPQQRIPFNKKNEANIDAHNLDQSTRNCTEKSDPKGGLIYHFIHMTFLKLQNHRNEEQIGGYQRRGEEGVVIKG